MNRRLIRMIAGITAFTMIASLPAFAALPGNLGNYTDSDFIRPSDYKQPTPVSNVDRAAVVKQMAQIIESWMGTPYGLGYCSRTRTDCSGFVMNVFAAIGVFLPRSSAEMYNCNLGPIVKGELQYGDVIIYPKLNYRVGHVAIYTGNGTTAETVGGHVGRSKLGVMKRPYIVRRFLDALFVGPSTPPASYQISDPVSSQSGPLSDIIGLIRENKIDELKSRLDADPDLVIRTDTDGANILHWAADKGTQEMVQMVLEHGVDINGKKTNGITALHIATGLNRPAIVEQLLRAGADATVRDNNDRTAYDIAIQNANGAIAKLLPNDPAEAASDKAEQGQTSQSDAVVTPAVEVEPAENPAVIIAPAMKTSTMEAMRDIRASIPTEPAVELIPVQYAIAEPGTAEDVVSAPVERALDIDTLGAQRTFVAAMEPVTATEAGQLALAMPLVSGEAVTIPDTKVDTPKASRAQEAMITAMEPEIEAVAEQVAEVTEPSDLEARNLFEMANRERAKLGLAPLEYDGSAEQVALARANDVVAKDPVTAIAAGKQTVEKMLRQTGKNTANWTESIAACGSVQVAYVSMTQAKDQSRSILNGSYTKTGIGVVQGGKWGRIYVVLLLES